MEVRHPLILRSCSLLVVLTLSGLVSSRHCDHHHFWDSLHRVCRPCARCPMNEIIYKPCGRHTDTVCGPFREFQDFKQLEKLDGLFSSYDYEAFVSDNSSRGGQEKGFPRYTEGLQNEPIVQKDDGEYWKNLAFALIGVVCVLIFVATVVVLLACRKLHETSAIKRPEEEDDDDSGYVVIRTIRPPNMVYRPPPVSRDMTVSPAAMALLQREGDDPLPQAASRLPQKKGAYKPKRRMLNYDADDVFESEDSAGSRTSRKVPLQPILERSVSSEGSDNLSSVSQVPI